MTEQLSQETLEALKEIPCTEEEFRQANSRRLELLDIEDTVGFTEGQLRELEQVEALVDQYMDLYYPVPTDVLEEAEAIVFSGRQQK